MAKAFRPQVRVSGESSQREFPTYSEVKKRMKDLLEVSDNNEVSVYRHRRGEWGEWFEKWAMINGKPQIFEKGWQ